MSIKSLFKLSLYLIIIICILSIVNVFVNSDNNIEYNIDNVTISNINITNNDNILYVYNSTLTSNIDNNYINYVVITFKNNNDVISKQKVFINKILNKSDSITLTVNTNINISNNTDIEYKFNYDKTN